MFDREREDARQLELLDWRHGEPWSGRVRYAAAVYFYQRGMISEEFLEVYRTCSVIDHEDARPVLASIGLIREYEGLKTRIGGKAEART